MKQLVSILMALGACLVVAGQTRAGFTLITDPAALNTNDTADWAKFDLGTGQFQLVRPLTSAVYGESIRWTHTDHSNPIFEGLVRASGRDLFIGTAVEPPFGTDTAFYDLNMYFDPQGLPVFGVAAQVEIGAVGRPGSAELIAYDADGNSQTFDLGSGYSGYLGVLSDEPLARLEIFDSHTGGQPGLGAGSTLIISPLQLDVAPAPPGLVLMGLGTLGLLGYSWRRKARQKGPAR